MLHNICVHNAYITQRGHWVSIDYNNDLGVRSMTKIYRVGT